ncbi:MAG: carboxypeptidase-like regulatory domain-containing protein [Terracidiphilus sp.]|jgi:hypothetical protein
MRRIPVVIFGCLLAAHSLLGQCYATVEGNVVDESGAPVAGAQVSFLEHGKVFTSKAAVYYETNSKGTFHAEMNLAGAQSYWILAKKEEAGYPDTLAAFYNEHEGQLVALDCGAFRSSIIVTLGPKVAHIRHISVVDEETGKPITNASITLRRLSSPIKGLPLENMFITESADLEPLSSSYLGLDVPPDCDVSYVISAPGYIASQNKTLHLKSSEEVDIEVQLRPDSSPLP